MSLLAVIFVTGCTGGGGGASATDEQKIHAVLNQYETAMKSMDGEKLAELATYPLAMDEVLIETKEEVVLYFTIAFLVIDEIHEFKLTHRVITLNGNEAVVESVAQSKITALGETVEAEEQHIMLLRKVGNSWKISG